MRSRGWPMVAVLAVMAGGAEAGDLIAQRPGLMCSDPKGLARLTMPDGSSRLKTSRATKADQEMAFVSQCKDIPLGARMPMGDRHHQTSTVYYEGSSGPGVYTVPNIDFSDPVPSAPAEKSFAELKLHSLGFDPKVNRALALTCQPAEYVHGIGNVLDCKPAGPLSVESAGVGMPTAIPCAVGALQLLPDGSFRMCRLTQPVAYVDYQQKKHLCPPGRTLARDMSGGAPEPTAFCT